MGMVWRFHLPIGFCDHTVIPKLMRDQLVVHCNESKLSSAYGWPHNCNGSKLTWLKHACLMLLAHHCQ